jgi:predicted hotdog family 3-hydroxylacyl-ACP dehydratase
VKATVQVPAGGAWFEGHFPGRPILPAVSELALMLATLEREAGGFISLRGIAHARFRRLVLPGDCLELASRDLDGGRLRVELKRDGAPVANAEFILGAPSAPVASTFPAPLLPAGAPPLDSLLPQRPPGRFVTAIAGETQDGLMCTASLPAASALVVGGSAPAFVVLEAAAQTAAVWEALRRWREGGTAAPRVGYVVAFRDVAFFSARVSAEAALATWVQLEAAAPPLAYYRAEVRAAGAPILRGTVATFLDGRSPEGERKVQGNGQD